MRSETFAGCFVWDNLNQRTTFTFNNRYPLVFRKYSDFFANNTYPRILSFGCSTGDKVSFYNRKSRTFENLAEFGAIFCMAVFQRTENRTSCDNGIAKGHTFEQFESEIEFLDQKLKVGGLFIIDHADFSFTDASFSISYKPLDFEQNQMLRRRPLYNKSNQKIADEQINYRVFEKVRS